MKKIADMEYYYTLPPLPAHVVAEVRGNWDGVGAHARVRFFSTSAPEKVFSTYLDIYDNLGCIGDGLTPVPYFEVSNPFTQEIRRFIYADEALMYSYILSFLKRRSPR